jgi:iron complex outermembrane receptor protein
MELSLMTFVEPKVLQRSERHQFRDFTRYDVGGSGVYRWRSRVGPGWESRLSAGVDEAFQDGAILFHNLEPDGSRGTTLRANKREAANSLGGFVEEELVWRERWSMRLAARWDALWYIAQDFVDPTLDAVKTFERVTPKASLSYRAGEHTVYAALGGGVEAPAFNEIDPPPGVAPTALNPFLEPMHSITGELGAKGGLAAPVGLGRIDYDAALYFIEVRNDIVPFNGGAYFFTAGRSQRRGGELGLAWRPVAAVRLNGAVSVSDNQYREYANDLGDFSGHEVPGLPRARYAAGARYDSPLGPYGEIRLEGAGRYYADDANTVRARAYNVVDAVLGVHGLLGRADASAFVGVDNLADQDYDASVFINGTGNRFFEPGLPRNWVAGVTVRGF